MSNVFKLKSFGLYVQTVNNDQMFFEDIPSQDPNYIYH